MKVKTFMRGFSLFETGAFGYIGYNLSNMLTHVDYQKVFDYLSNDNPLELKVLGTTLLAGEALLTLGTGVFVADGIISTVKGQPFYGILKTWEKFSKNSSKKEKLTETLKLYESIKENQLFPKK